MFSLNKYILRTGSTAPGRAREGGDVCSLYIYIVGTGSTAPGRAGEGDVCSLSLYIYCRDGFFSSEKSWRRRRCMFSLYIYIVGTGSPAPGRAGEGGDVCSLLR